ncbi:hypothetical protein H2199_003969 [Coniosporium tulheliwenetii]|uniref:Uncharacterized protein n=1 Tax=Coniosporium tulheliwenetii TaxID=3383036 RepID=A0ACC2Z8V5_9PEZI|nr:hypothetical protein H2199_003969 [Cladosporium sp. JES 115]
MNTEPHAPTLPEALSNPKSIVLRSLFTPPTHPDGSVSVSTSARHRVIIRHPGYDDADNDLMVLQASDHSDSGIHHATALVMCSIVAGNRWDGFFTQLKNGLRVELQPDDVLEEEIYYFHIPTGDGASQIDDSPSSGGSTLATSHSDSEDNNVDFEARESRRFDYLRAEYLEKERNRSDPKGFWLTEQAWAKTAVNSVLSSDDVRRLYKIRGADVPDDP